MSVRYILLHCYIMGRMSDLIMAKLECAWSDGDAFDGDGEANVI